MEETKTNYLHRPDPQSTERYHTQTRNWLREFERCVRDRDFDGALKLFNPRVLSFGTIAQESDNLEELVSRQWRAVWPETEDFTFLLDCRSILRTSTRLPVVVTCQWTSVGLATTGRFKRNGRCTIVLDRSNQNRSGLEAIHTHFSKAPEGAL